MVRIALVFIITAACAALPGASKSRLDDAFYAVFNFAFFSPFVLASVFWLASRLLSRQRFGAVLAQVLLASAALLLVMPIIRASELTLFAGVQSDRFAWLGRLRTHPTLLLWGIVFTLACALLGSLLALLLVRWAASQSRDTKENFFLAYLMPLAGSLGLFVVLYATALSVPAFAHTVGAGLRWMTATAILIALIACLLYVRDVRRSA
jgi:hypothetical protein